VQRYELSAKTTTIIKNNLLSHRSFYAYLTVVTHNLEDGSMMPEAKKTGDSHGGLKKTAYICGRNTTIINNKDYD
jgi:hypothetical protein